MSVRIMAMVWASGLPKNQKFTLLAYADHANDEGDSIYPGEESMCEKTSDSPRTVQRVTAQLVKAGLLVYTRRGGRGRRAAFRIDVELLASVVARHDELARQYGTLTVVDPDIEPATGDELARHIVQVSPPLVTDQPATGDAPNHQEPSGTTSESSIAMKPSNRRVNDGWDFLTAVDTFNLPTRTKTQRRDVGRLSREINATLDHLEVPPDERAAVMRTAAQSWPEHFGEATLTPNAFAKHLTQLTRPPLRGDPHLIDAARKDTEDQELIERMKTRVISEGVT